MTGSALFPMAFQAIQSEVIREDEGWTVTVFTSNGIGCAHDVRLSVALKAALQDSKRFTLK